MEEETQIKIQKNKIDISWEYTKQLSDILSRQYLQFFVLYFTIAVSILITSIVERLNFILCFHISAIFFLFATYYIYRLNSVKKDLIDDYNNITSELEKLI